jgi:hypothetical protein
MNKKLFLSLLFLTLLISACSLEEATAVKVNTPPSTQKMIGARSRQRDDIRLANIMQIQTALELYLNDNGEYPDRLDFGGALRNSETGTTYMAMIPLNPSPNDGACPDDFIFMYRVKDAGRSYNLIYCLGEEVQKNYSTISAGVNIATPASLSGGK